MSLLISLINRLSDPEKQSIRHWLNCQVHNQQLDLLAMFDLLTESENIPEDTEIWQHLYPTLSFNPQQLRLKCSYLLSRIEDWIAYQGWQETTAINGESYLTDFYRRRGMNKHLDNRLLRRRKIYQKQPPVSPAALTIAYELEEQFMDRALSTKRTTDHNLREMKLSGLTLVIATQLRAACRTLSFRQIAKETEDSEYLSACLKEAAKDIYLNQPAIKLFRLACLSLLHPEEEAKYATYEAELQAGIHLHPKSEQKELLTMALNHCVRGINAGNNIYLGRALRLYRLGLKQDLLTRQRAISYFTFSNIVGIALRLGEFDFTATFLREYQDRLPAQQGAEVYALNAARFAYATGDKEKALVELRGADYQDFIHHLNARTLQAKIYRELGYNNLLASHLKNTRALLARKKGQSYHLTNYRNFFRLLTSIERLPAGRSSNTATLLAKIEKTDPLTEKKWLLQQL